MNHFAFKSNLSHCSLNNYHEPQKFDIVFKHPYHIIPHTTRENEKINSRTFAGEQGTNLI